MNNEIPQSRSTIFAQFIKDHPLSLPQLNLKGTRKWALLLPFLPILAACLNVENGNYMWAVPASIDPLSGQVEGTGPSSGGCDLVFNTSTTIMAGLGEPVGSPNIWEKPSTLNGYTGIVRRNLKNGKQVVLFSPVATQGRNEGGGPVTAALVCPGDMSKAELEAVISSSFAGLPVDVLTSMSESDRGLFPGEVGRSLRVKIIKGEKNYIIQLGSANATHKTISIKVSIGDVMRAMHGLSPADQTAMDVYIATPSPTALPSTTPTPIPASTPAATNTQQPLVNVTTGESGTPESADDTQATPAPQAIYPSQLNLQL